MNELAKVQKHVGAKAKAIRESKSLSLDEVFKKSGYRWDRLSNFEKGKNNATLKTMCSIANGLEVSVADFFEGYTPDE